MQDLKVYLVGLRAAIEEVAVTPSTALTTLKVEPMASLPPYKQIRRDSLLNYRDSVVARTETATRNKVTKTPSRGRKLKGGVPDIMASTSQYLSSCITRSSSASIRDVHTQDVPESPPDRKLNAKKLERLFETHGVMEAWHEHTEFSPEAEDLLDYGHTIVLDEVVRSDAPYDAWAKRYLTKWYRSSPNYHRIGWSTSTRRS